MAQRQSLSLNLIDLAIAGCFSVILILMVLISIVPSLIEESHRFKTSSVPTALLDTGKVGRILKNQGLVHVEDNSGLRYPLAYNAQDLSDDKPVQPFRRKRKAGSYLYRANGSGKKHLPSTVQARPALIPGSVPLVSVAVSDRSLNDPTHGLIANSYRNNRATEKPGTVSLFADIGLIAAGGVGVRLSGSRIERGAASRVDVPSLELFLRKSYGLETIPGDAVFVGDDEAPDRDLSGLVIERNNMVSQELALTLADLAGLTVPLHRPGYVQFNGQPPALFLIREPVSIRQWQKATAAAELDFIKNDDDEADPGWHWHKEMEAWFERVSPRITMDAVNSYIDLENLTDTLVFMMFCGSPDWSHWAMYRDRRKHPLWTGITWDVQTCFEDRWGTGAGHPASQHWLEVAAVPTSDGQRLRATYNAIRPKLFAELMNQDPDYPAYFYTRMQGFLERLESGAEFDEHISALTSLINDPPVSSVQRRIMQRKITEVVEFIPARIAYIRSEMQVDCLSRSPAAC